MSALRARLAKLLHIQLQKVLGSGAVIVVDPNTLYPATGWYRTSPQADCVRWEGFFKWGTTTCSIYSWHPMTDCCKNQITLRRERPTEFEVQLVAAHAGRGGLLSKEQRK